MNGVKIIERAAHGVVVAKISELMDCVRLIGQVKGWLVEEEPQLHEVDAIAMLTGAMAICRDTAGMLEVLFDPPAGYGPTTHNEEGMK